MPQSRIRRITTRVLFTAALVLPVACGQSTPPAPPDPAADTVFLNARVYTVNDTISWADAIAIREGKIIAVGTDADIETYAGEGTTVVDLDGRMVMPGIHDTHIHAGLAGEQQQLECYFLTFDLQEVLDTLQGCIDETPDGEWVRGGQWYPSLFPPEMTPREILDEIAPDHPVFLMDWSWHNGWVNSRALDVFGIDDDTPDPPGGIIERDLETGRATGLLLDNAAYSLIRELPAYPLEDRIRALQWSLAQITPHGVTTIKEAIVTQSIAETFAELDRRGDLPVRVKTSLTWKNPFATSHEDEVALIDDRANLATDRIDTPFAKIMLDGIPPTYTAAMLDPYEPSDAFGSDWRGKLIFQPEELNPDVVRLDAMGLSVKIHATGDRSVRAALDAFEAARDSNGNDDIIHEVSHAELIHKDDLPRFAELNVAAEMCPILWHPIPGLTWELWLGPDRKVWPVKDLLEADALVTYGSDWSVVPTPNPWPGIEAMVTRAEPVGNGTETLWSEQGIGLADAIRIFTINSAIANKVGATSGSLETGKDADFIVLDRNIFEVPITEVSDTQVLVSVIGGETLFDNR